MEPTASPKFFRFFRILIVTFGKPGGSDNNLACGPAVIRKELTAWIGNLDINKRNRHSRLDGDIAFLFVIIVLHGGLQIGHADNRTGLGHTIARHNLNTQFDARHGQTLGKAGSADDHFPR